MSHSAKRFPIRRRRPAGTPGAKRRAKRPDFEPLEDRRLLTIAFRSSMGIAGSLIKTDAVVTDSTGNDYVTGSFAGRSNFSPSSGTSILSNGQTDIFVAKYAPSGALLWAKSFGGPTADQGKAIALDGSGNVFLTGSFSGQVTFNPGSVLTSNAPTNTFVLKLNSSGGFQWAEQILGSGPNAGSGIVVDIANRVDVLGTFSGAATLTTSTSNQTIAAPGASSVFLASVSTTTGSQIAVFEAIAGTGIDAVLLTKIAA
jgi:Beta-propeller repeat